MEVVRDERSLIAKLIPDFHTQAARKEQQESEDSDQRSESSFTGTISPAPTDEPGFMVDKDVELWDEVEVAIFLSRIGMQQYQGVRSFSPFSFLLSSSLTFLFLIRFLRNKGSMEIF